LTPNAEQFAEELLVFVPALLGCAQVDRSALLKVLADRIRSRDALLLARDAEGGCTAATFQRALAGSGR
jgi:hypothetical protein